MKSFSPFLVLCGLLQLLCLFFFSRIGYNEFSDSNASGYGGYIISEIYREFIDIHVMILIGFGFLMTFLHKYGYSALSYNFLVSVLIMQWGIISAGFASKLFEDDSDSSDSKIDMGSGALYAGDFGAATALITLGALLGKVSPSQILFLVFLEIPIFSIMSTFLYEDMGIADIGGTITIHLFGCYFGLGASWVLSPKTSSNHNDNNSSRHSDIFSMIGTLFLFIFWPSFVGGLAVGNARNRAILNTAIAIAASAFSTFTFSHLMRDRKFMMVDIQNATLAGGVAIGAVADMMLSPGTSILIGFAAGIISTIGYVSIQPKLEKVLGIRDTCGVNNLHGMPAIMGAVFSFVGALYANTETYGTDENIAVVFASVPADRTAGEQAKYQLLALAVNFVIAIVTGILCGLIVKLPIFRPYNAYQTEHALYHDSTEFNTPDTYFGAKTYAEKIDALYKLSQKFQSEQKPSAAGTTVIKKNSSEII